MRNWTSEFAALAAHTEQEKGIKPVPGSKVGLVDDTFIKESLDLVSCQISLVVE